MDTIETREIWQVEVDGNIYEADPSELPSWIADGSLQPADKIRRGNLRWIEAGKAPTLSLLFEAKAHGLPIPEPFAAPVSTDGRPAHRAESPAIARPASPDVHSFSKSTAPHDPDACSVHQDLPSFFICEKCTSQFCKTCPKSFGGSVKICPACGAFCKPLKEHRADAARTEAAAAAISEGFGTSDFFAALAHPLRFKVSLVVGAIMFTAFSLGREASVLGGVYLFVASMLCMMLANMLTFGVLAKTADKFSRGELDVDFMPEFETFSIWDDVVHPFVLSVSVYIVSFGAFALVLTAGLYVVTSQVQTKNSAIMADLEKIPGTQFYTAKDTVRQSDDVRALLADAQRQNMERLQVQQQIANGNVSAALAEPESAKASPATREVGELDPSRLASSAPKAADVRVSEEPGLLEAILSLPAPMVVIGFITLLWGFFYYPAACAVAGYTRSFNATLDPSVGLDTIKRLGTVYAKVLIMCGLLFTASTVFGWGMNTMLSPLNLPGLGNLPAKGLNSLFAFYLYVVFSCIIGYALFKSSDRLQLLK